MNRVVANRENDTAGGLLFTAFEPSGDSLAAPVIGAMRELSPDTPIWAMGGPQMQEAGASMIELTTERPVMHLGAATHAWIHYRRLQRLKSWLSQHRIQALVPVDSPAANWSICKQVRRQVPGVKIFHLAAPQLWAWATWRIHKLRRLTDHVLCLVPFEPDWFKERGVPATFVGHPLFDHRGHRAGGGITLDSPPVAGGSKLALLPGSRPGEIRVNLPTMLSAFTEIQKDHRGLAGLIAVDNEMSAERVRHAVRGQMKTGGFPDGLDMRIGQTDAVLHWCDLALVKSGTITLQVAAHRRPMVAMYNLNWWGWQLLGRWVVRTRPLTLPNLISKAAGSGPAIIELVPHWGAVEPVVKALKTLISDPAARAQQISRFEEIASQFAGHRFAAAAAGHLAAAVDAGPPPAPISSRPVG